MDYFLSILVFFFFGLSIYLGFQLSSEQDAVKRLLHKQKQEQEYMQKLESDCKSFLEKCNSNISLFPYMAGVIADIETHDYVAMAKALYWGSDQRRLKKVASLLEVKKDAAQKIAAAKQSEYQLQYLLKLFPALEELLNYEYAALPKTDFNDLSAKDGVRDYLSKEEWERLSTSARNQLALDRYMKSSKKTNWQIGREYEEYVAYVYRSKGYSVDTYGAYKGLEDLGRDLIAIKGKIVHIIQCKYWSTKKTIHEKHINQLFGTMTSYSIEHDSEKLSVCGVFVTSTSLSPTAHAFANRLKIDVLENFPIGPYPMIKCNIGKSGEKIYHLPFDQQYDASKISKPGEFYAMTVAEAEQAGFRRAFKWLGSN